MTARRAFRLVPLAVTALAGCSLFVDTEGFGGGDEATTVAADAGTLAAEAGAADAASSGSDAAPAEIVLRGVQTAGPVDGERLTLNVPVAQPGDFMLVALYHWNPQAQVTGLEGWQARASVDPKGQDGNHGTHSLRIFSKVATANEPASYVLTIAEPFTGDFVAGISAAWGGTSPTQPIDVEKLVTYATKPGSVPEVTTNFPGDVLVAITSTTYGKGASWTPPTGMTERASTGVLGLFMAPAQGAPGPTGVRPYATSAQYDTGLGALVLALRRP